MVMVIIVAIVLEIVVVVIVGVVILVAGGVSSIFNFWSVIIGFLGFEEVTFPSILLGNPPMKTSMSFSEFGTMFEHKSADSWNLLILGDLVGLLYPNRLGICIPPGQGIVRQRVSLDPRFLLGLSVFAMIAASASRAAAIPSEINCQIVA
nr:hypothetical protein [Tanacetum cinerariifolium]